MKTLDTVLWMMFCTILFSTGTLSQLRLSTDPAETFVLRPAAESAHPLGTANAVPVGIAVPEFVVVPPTAPLLIAPANGVAALPVVHAYFTWSVPAGATTYGIQFDLDSNFTPAYVSFAGLGGNAVWVTGFAKKTSYYWRINATNSAGTSPWSEIRMFTTESTPDTVKNSDWVTSSSGLTNNSINALVSSGTNLFSGTNGGGVFLTGNNGTSWSEFNTGITNTLINALVVSGPNLIAGTQGGVYISPNNLPVWKAYNTGLATTDVRVVAASGTNIYAGTTNGFFLSTNNGASWTAANAGLTNNDIRSIIVSGSTVIAGTTTGAFMSVDNSTSWTPTDLKGVAVYALCLSGHRLFAGTSGGLYVSQNDGTSWTSIITGLSNLDIRTLAVTGASMFAGSPSGVIASSDSGASWVADYTGWVNTPVRAFALSSTHLFAGTSAGVYKRVLPKPATFVETMTHAVPSQFALDQNYPNPFNPSTTFSFRLTAPSRVTLVVYDALGREVAVVVNDELSAGTYTRQWNAIGLPSGMFFYRLQAGTFTATKKLVIMK